MAVFIDLPPPFLLGSRCLFTHQERIRARRAGDRCLWILANNRAQVRFEIFKAHRRELLPFGGLRYDGSSC